MAEKPPLPPKSALQKPPGYRDPEALAPSVPPRKPPQLPPTLRYPGKPPPRRSRGRGRGRSCCCRLCCWVSFILLIVIFLVAIVGAIAYLWFQPRLPSFRIESLRASRFNISSRSDGSSSLDAAVAVGLQVANPNGKVGLTYGDLEARVSVTDDDGDVDLGSAIAGGFAQGKRNSTMVRFAVSAKGTVVDETVGRRIARRFRSRDLNFGLEVRTKVGLRLGGKSTGRLPIRVACGSASLRQAAGVGGATLPKCHIYLFRWINLH